LGNKKALVLWECNRTFHEMNYLSKVVIEWLGVRVCVCVYIYIYTYIHTYIHTYTYLTVYRLYELSLLPNDTAVKHFYTNRSGAKC